MKNIVPLLLFVFYTSTALALDGRVVGVTDGDTIKLIDSNNNPHKIRLHGIDAPEKNQAFGQASKRQSMRGLWADHDPIPPWDWRKSRKAH